MGISTHAMSIVNSILFDVFERVASEAGRLARYNKQATITSREIQTAVRLLFPAELAKHAVAEGTKAVMCYSSSVEAGANIDAMDFAEDTTSASSSTEEFLLKFEDDDDLPSPSPTPIAPVHSIPPLLATPQFQQACNAIDGAAALLQAGPSTLSVVSAANDAFSATQDLDDFLDTIRLLLSS